MKARFVVRAIVAMALSMACVLTVACDAGSIPALKSTAGGSTQNPEAGSVTVSLSRTQHPQVANLTVKMACAGQAMVEFGPDTSYGRSTAWYPVASAFVPTSILVAGMTASSTYHMRAQTQCDGNATTSADQTFATGPLPSSGFPKLTVTRPNPSLSSTENPGIELIDITVASVLPFFTDRDGNPIWYYNVGQGNYAFPFKPMPNGHMLLNVVSPYTSTLTEIDLAGNIIRQMSVQALQIEIAAAGFDFSPFAFHHDFIPLANGHVIALVECAKDFTNLTGYPGTLQVIGDAIVDLDQNWNPVWAWNSFDYLDVNRHLDGLPDWTHSNTLVYSPDDGNLLISMRNQSWILKIDYENGTGSGNILWHLGYQGDFALTNQGVASDDPSLWFSNQHFPIILSQNGSQTTLGIFDNGDNRPLNTDGELCQFYPGTPYPACYSRPVVFQVDESAMVANIAWADPLSYFSIWGGSINQFPNGNVEFDLNDPIIPPSPNVASQVQEVTPSAPQQVVWQMNIAAPDYAYRAYRFPSLYNGVTWPY